MNFTPEQLKEIAHILEANPKIEAAFLHGSMNKGTARSDSDVDIALLPVSHAKISTHERLLSAAQLEELLHRPIDLGILSSDNLIYAKEVIANGTELFTKNPLHSAMFIATALSMYAELQQQRKEVLHAYSA
jgi:predicted nucleotidyltransferase